MLFPVFGGGAAGILLKIVAEMGGLGKPKEVGDLLDGEGGIEEEGFGFGGRLFGDPGAGGLAGLALNDVAEIGGMEVLQDGVVAGAEYFFCFPADKVTVMVLQVAFEALYDMGAAVALVNWVIIFPEIFFYLQQQDDEEAADDPVFVGRATVVFLIDEQVEIFELRKGGRIQQLGADRLGQQERELLIDIMVDILLQEGFIKGDEISFFDLMPLEGAVVAGVGEIDHPRLQVEGHLVDRIMAIGILDKDEIEIIGPEAGGTDGQLFQEVFQIMDRKSRPDVEQVDR